MNRILVMVAAGGSLATLLAAFGFQYLGGLAPCHLCLLQRWPHAAAVVIGLLALAWPWRWFCAGGALAALTTAAIGVYHSGVERHWWEGPTTCTAGSIAGLKPDELLSQILATPVVRCDELGWTLLGLSMANLNVVLSLGLALIWLAAARR